jgi:hypothetical protein
MKMNDHLTHIKLYYQFNSPVNNLNNNLNL